MRFEYLGDIVEDELVTLGMQVLRFFDFYIQSAFRSNY